MEMMLKATDDMPVNIGFTGKVGLVNEFILSLPGGFFSHKISMSSNDCEY
jgi:urease alpha subunit